MAIEQTFDLPQGISYPTDEPTEVRLGEVQEDGSLEAEILDEEALAEELIEEIELEFEHDVNLAEVLDDAILDSISSDLQDKIEKDEESRKEWLDIMSKGIKLLGLDIEELSQPFPGACGCTHPLLLEAVTKFQAKSFSELFPSKGPVKTQIVGNSNPERDAQAKRVKTYMNYQVQHLMPEYGPELDRMLFYLGLFGSAFKKEYYDPELQRPVSQFIKAEDFIVPYYITSLATAERYTHKLQLTKNKLLKSMVSGLYRSVDLADPTDPEETSPQEDIDKSMGRARIAMVDDIYTVYECHTILNIDHPALADADGIALPYIVTLDSDSGEILAIYRNWREGDPLREKRMYFTDYHFVPGLGFYGYGYLHLIGGLAKTATFGMRNLVDAGTLSNLPAGFKAQGIRVVGEGGPFVPGEFKDVNAPMGDLQKSFFPLPFKEPSMVLFQLMQFIVEAGEKFADRTEAMVSEAKNYGPVGTIMALLEQGGKMFSAIHKRLHASQMQELKILAELNYDNLPDEYPYEVAGGQQKILRQDFDGRIDVMPVSDPNMPSQSHRIAKSQAIWAIALQAPQEHNMPAVLERVYDSMDVEDYEKLMKPKQQDARPLDPVSENMAVMKNLPVRAGNEQNHTAHIRAHAAFMQMPQVGKNEQMAMALMAHIHEHFALEYKIRIQNILGQALPPPGQPMPPEVEARVAMASAQATEQMMQEEIFKQVMQDPAAMVGMESVDAERQQNMLKYEEAIMKLDLERAKLRFDYDKLMVNDANEDADRESQEKIAAARKKETNNGNG